MEHYNIYKQRLILLLVLSLCICKSVFCHDLNFSDSTYINYTEESNECYSKGIELYNIKQYDKAKDYFEKCHNIDVATLGPDDDRIYHSVMWYARCLYMMGNEEEANNYSRWFKVEPVHRNKTLVSDSLSYIASIYAKEGNIKKALELTLNYAEIERKNFGENYWYANSLTTIAVYYLQLQDYKKALDYNYQALSIREEILGKMHIDCYLSNNTIANILYHNGNLNEAAKHYIDALITLYSLSAANENIDVTLNNIYNCLLQIDPLAPSSSDLFVYISKNLPQEVTSLLMTNLKMDSFNQLKYKEAKYYAKFLCNLYHGNKDENELFALTEYAVILKNNGEYKSALDVYKQIVHDFGEQQNESIVYAASLREYADTYFILGEITQAYEMGKKSVDLLRQICKKDKDYSSLSALSWSINMQSRFCNALAKFKEALLNVDESISILNENKDIISDYNPRIVRSMISKAKILSDSGDNENSYIVISDCISKIKEDTLCTLFDYANALDVSVEILYRNMRIDDALIACDDFLSILDKTTGINERYINVLEKKASIFMLKGEYATALQYYEQICSMVEELFATNSMRYVSSMNNASICRFSVGDTKGALDISNKLCKIKELTNVGNESILYQVLFQKAIYETHLELTTQAIEDFKFTLDVLGYLEKSMYDSPDIHTTKASIYSNMALAYYLEGNDKEAANSINMARDIYVKYNVDNTLSFAEMEILRAYILDNSDEDLSSLKNASEIISDFVGKNNIMYLNAIMALTSTCFKSNNIEKVENYASQCYDVAIKFLDGNKLNLNNTLRSEFWNKCHTLFSNDIPHMAAKFKTPTLCSLAYNSSLYQKFFLLNSNNIIKNTILQSKDSLLLKHYEKYINLQSNLYSRLEESEYKRDNKLVDSLHNEELFLLNRCPQLNNLNLETCDWKNIQNVLGNQDLAVEILSYDDDDETYYIAICIDKSCKYPHIHELYKESMIDSLIDNNGLFSETTITMLMEPFLEITKNYKSIYLSPTGKLNFIPFENFIDEKNIYRLSSTSQICEKKPSSLSTAVLYGGLDYDADISNTNINNYDNNSVYEYVADALSREEVEFLPGTMNEVEAISGILKDNSIEANVYLRNRGTKKSFISLSGRSSEVIHLATHGRYVPTQDVVDYKKRRNLNFLLTNYDANVMSFDDLLLSHSYVIFAGGNALFKHKEIPENCDNGILTALEISQLDLSKTNLVVLSACQSGLGKTRADGVIGLQYGFKRAGVKSLLVSLGNVDDKATEKLMVKFYKNLYSGKNKVQSLHDAQKYLREFDNGKYSDSKYWAPFILLDALD